MSGLQLHSPAVVHSTIWLKASGTSTVTTEGTLLSCCFAFCCRPSAAVWQLLRCRRAQFHTWSGCSFRCPAASQASRSPKEMASHLQLQRPSSRSNHSEVYKQLWYLLHCILLPYCSCMVVPSATPSPLQRSFALPRKSFAALRKLASCTCVTCLSLVSNAHFLAAWISPVGCSIEGMCLPICPFREGGVLPMGCREWHRSQF